MQVKIISIIKSVCMFLNNKFNRKTQVIFLGIVALLILCLGIRCFITPIYLSNEEISKIDIALHVSSLDVSAVGYATIDDEKAIKEAIGILNDIKVIPGRYSVHDLEGDSPSAWIVLYDGKEEIDDIYIYYNIIRYHDKYYRISVSEYDALIDLCRQYGYVWVE